MEFQRNCRARGIRVTPQRLATYRALAEDTGHPTAEEVYRRLRHRLPSLSPATVYRILESLEREGLVRRVSTTRGIGRFDANLASHQHLLCSVCGRIADVSIPALRRVRAAPNPVAGFVVERIDICIIGRCRGCLPSARWGDGGKARRA